jgi:hypothetical protein
MWPRTNSSSNGTWKIATITLGICLLFASTLAAQQDQRNDRQDLQDDRQDRRDDRQDNRQERDAYGGVPRTLTIPAGTAITGELAQYLSSHENRPGDTFSMTLTQPLVVNGWVVARVGQLVHGEVTVANKGGRGKGPSQLGIELTEIPLVDGQQLPVITQLIRSTGGSNTGRNVATVATTTGAGAVIGAIAGEGEGAAIGAAAGAAAGVIGVLMTSGKPTIIDPESQLTFRLTAPVSISTEGSERAFLPVSPQDYRATSARVRYSQPPPRPYVRPYPVPYAYPYPYFYGPRITIIRPYRGGFRGGFGRGRR